MSESDLVSSNRHAVRNRVEVFNSDACGCFHCLATFEPSTIRSWIDTGLTALCPRCGMDAVIGSASGIELTDEFLGSMQGRWFKERKTA
jgi:hypothetical protein